MNGSESKIFKKFFYPLSDYDFVLYKIMINILFSFLGKAHCAGWKSHMLCRCSLTCLAKIDCLDSKAKVENHP